MKRTLTMIAAGAMLLGFSTRQEKCYIVMGYAVIDEKCTTGSLTTSFPNAVGLASIHSRTGKLSEMADELQTRLAVEHGVKKFNTRTFVDNKPYGVAIQYEKPLPGYGSCTTTYITVGFGNTQAEAEAEAVRQKNIWYSKGSYAVIKVVKCD